MRPGKKERANAQAVWGESIFRSSYLNPTKAPRADPVTRLICWSNSGCHELDWKNNVCRGCAWLRRPPFSKVVGPATSYASAFHYSIHIKLVHSACRYYHLDIDTQRTCRPYAWQKYSVGVMCETSALGIV